MRANDSARSIRAQKLLAGRLDYILDIYEAKDFVEICGKVSGDSISYRVYDDGRITER